MKAIDRIGWLQDTREELMSKYSSRGLPVEPVVIWAWDNKDMNELRRIMCNELDKDVNCMRSCKHIYREI